MGWKTFTLAKREKFIFDSAPYLPPELGSLLPDVQAGRRKQPKRLMEECPAGRREPSSGGGYVAGASNFAFFVNGALPEPGILYKLASFS